MSVQELNRVHRRYIKVSNSFKSAWTFHQFIQGLRKIFLDDGPRDYPADFQTVYNELKQVSKTLAETTVDEASQQLDEVEKGLEVLVEALLAADQQVAPELLRQFFQRVKNYDDNILSQLVKFYLYFHGDGWSPDRLDKADYLSTKVCEEYQDSNDAYILRDRTHVRETAQGFWSALGREPLPASEVEGLAEEIQTMRHEIADAASIDQLHERQLVQRYRSFKHALGDDFFEPRVLQEIVETNLVLKNHVQKLYRRDEERIIAEYQQVFDLEKATPVDGALRGELAEFREAVERFEHQLQEGENVRLHDLAGLRDRVRNILPRLQPGLPVEVETPPAPEVSELFAESEPPGAEKREAVVAEAENAYVAEQMRTVIAVLDDTNPTLEPRKTALQPEVFSLGVEAREIVAYRRLFGSTSCDRRREQLVLRAAATRVRIEDDVDRIRSILDDSSVTRDTPAFVEARDTVSYADLVLRRLEHLIELAVLDADAAEARALQRVKMKLTRSHAGLWLLIYKD